MQPICVIGSLNVDLVINIPRFHAPGETIMGSQFTVFTGGKGGNQAVALGRLGADAAMVGMVGEDLNGQMYLDTLKKEGIDASHVGTCSEATGVALIEVNDATGDNRIALAAGANMLLTPERLLALWPQIAHFDYFLIQFETPMETVALAAELISKAGKVLILDPAPAQPVSDALLAHTTYITPNETELGLLTGLPTRTAGEITLAAQSLLARGAKQVVAKMGANGAMLVSAHGAAHVPGFKVKAVDTTAAGDSFNAGFAFALSQGMTDAQAVRYANAVGALATTAMGAQGAMPAHQQVTALMNEQPL